MRRLGWLALLVACTPDMGQSAALVVGERILGARAEPAEAGPGDTVRYASLVASPSGTVASPDLGWSLCKLRKPVSENTPVSQACLTETLPLSAQGGQVTIRIPSAACVNFGPLAPPSTGASLRPTDPDATGGYYQPIRLDLGAEHAVFRQRVRCDLAGASLLQAQEFRARYVANKNPTLLSLSALVGGVPVALDLLPGNQHIRLLATWSADAAETYPVFDPTTQTLADHREALWLSWFTTAGTIDDFETGRDERDPANWTENGWQAPAAPGSVWVWLVLHDSRGGVDVASYALTVVP